MRIKTVLSSSAILLSGLACSSCNQNPKHVSVDEYNSDDDKKVLTEIVLKEYGSNPQILNIEEYTLANTDFRITLWTGGNLQVTLMSIPAGGDVGLERHPDIDQFLRIEEGKGKVMMGNHRDSLTFMEIVHDDFAIFIPAGQWHNLVNIGDKPLKLYSVYAPVEHPAGTVHQTQAESIEADAAHQH